ncbi:MAG: hypothetical protein WCO60_17130 [Verrucomicrobiota bacterium]
MASQNHNLRVSLSAVALVSLTSGLIWWIGSKSSTSPDSQAASFQNSASPTTGTLSPTPPFRSGAPPALLPSRVATPEKPYLAWERFLAVDGSPEEDIASLNDILITYLQAARSPARPAIGFNEDLLKTLTDRSILGDAAIPKNHPAIRDGRLIDRWGTPWQVHPISGDFIQLRSAGPDHRLYTDDDLILPKTPSAQP